MVSLSTSNSLLNYVTAPTTADASSAGTGTATTSAAVKARVAATAQAALQAAGSTHQASVASRALDKQQATLASDLRTAMA